jgi:hypothetical protein
MTELEESEQQILIDEKSSILFDLLHLALLENKYDIVSFLLQHEINLEKFLEYGRLKQLYNNEIVSSISLPLKLPLLHVHSTKSTTKLLNFVIKLYNFNLCFANCKKLNIMAIIY